MELLPGRGGQYILVKGVQQFLRQLIGGQAHYLRKFLPLGGGHLTVETDDPVGQRGEGVLVPRPQRHSEHQFLQRNGGLALQGPGVRLFGGGDPHSVHNDKVVLILRGRGRDLLQIVLAEDAGSPALHLLKIVPAAHIPHEDQALDGLHIGAGGNHVHSDGDPGVVAVAETAEGPLRVLGRVGDLLAELVPLAELLPDDLDDVVGVAVRLGKDQRLGNFAPAGKQLGEQILPERADHRADLTGVDDIPVQLGGPVVHILVHLLPPLFP